MHLNGDGGSSSVDDDTPAALSSPLSKLTSNQFVLGRRRKLDLLLVLAIALSKVEA